MNVRVDPQTVEIPLALTPEMRMGAPSARHGCFRLIRRPSWNVGFSRILRGGRVDDIGRLPRYGMLGALSLLALWVPVMLYLSLAPTRFTSEVSLILPGSGASASVNLSDIGQASSSASSPYSSSAVSPTATYKRLLGANRVLVEAARRIGIDRRSLGAPRIRLVDETSLILFELTGANPEEAQIRARAVLGSFLDELDRLRVDEVARREASARAPIEGYEREVRRIRDRIGALQRESGLTSVAQYEALVADAEALEVRVRETKARLEQKESEMYRLSATLGVDTATAALTLKLHSDTEFQSLADTMSAHAADLATARGKYGERHPQLVAARDAHAGARARLYSRAEVITGMPRDAIDQKIDMSPGGERGALLAELIRVAAAREGLAAELETLSASHAARADDVVRLMGPAAKLDDLNRDYQVAEAVFASAMARTDTTKSDIYASYPLVQVLEDASLAEAPSSPKANLAIAAGAGASFFLLIALALAWMRRPLIGRLLSKSDE